MTLIACHTNLDSAPGGLADIVGEALGLRKMAPLQSAAAGWYKLVGFVPAGRGGDAWRRRSSRPAPGASGLYGECAFATSWDRVVHRGGRAAIPRWEVGPGRNGLRRSGGRRWCPEDGWRAVSVPSWTLIPTRSRPSTSIRWRTWCREPVSGGWGRLPNRCRCVAWRSGRESSSKLSGVSWSGDGERLVRRSRRTARQWPQSAGRRSGTVRGAAHRGRGLPRRRACCRDGPVADRRFRTVSSNGGRFRRWAEGFGQELAGEVVSARLSREAVAIARGHRSRREELRRSTWRPQGRRPR